MNISKVNFKGDEYSVGTIKGVKGNLEQNYRTGRVNLTPDDLGAVSRTGDTMSGNLYIGNPANTGDSGLTVSIAGYSGTFGIGSTSRYLGIYDRTHSKWVVYSDTNGNVVLNGAANSATTATTATRANQLTTARNFQVNLASTAAASFNGTANTTPGVTGILAIGNGGTGNNAGYIRTGQKLGTSVGPNSTIEGESNTVSGGYSHAEGYSNTVSGGYSHAGGLTSTVSGLCSYVFGNSCKVIGDYSFSGGSLCETLHDYSFTYGFGCRTGISYQTVVGCFNTVESGNTPRSYFIVGGGSDNTHRTSLFSVNSNYCIGKDFYTYKLGRGHGSYKNDNYSIALTETINEYVSGVISNGGSVIVTVPVRSGSYLLITREYNTSTGAYRGSRIHMWVTPENETAAITSATIYSSTNSGCSFASVHYGTTLGRSIAAGSSYTTYFTLYALLDESS